MLGNLFLSPWTCENRNMVRSEKQKGKIYDLNEEEFIGHIYKDNRCYHTYYLHSGMDNIARFICSNDQDKFLTSSKDDAVLTTIGKYLDLACLEEQEQINLILLIQKYQKQNTDFTYKN